MKISQIGSNSLQRTVTTMAELKPCPVCGSKAFISRDVVDGFYVGWSVGCPRFCIGDGIHGIDTPADAETRGLTCFGFLSKEEAVEWWNRRVNDGR